MIHPGVRSTLARIAPALVVAGVLTAAVAQPGRGGMPVAVTTLVERELPASIRLVGTVRPDKSAIVAAETNGLIARFPAEEGDELAQGDLICALDDEVARLRLEEARALLEQRRATLAELEAGEREEDLRRLAAAVEEAEALFDKAEFERNRIARLFEQRQANPKEKNDAEMDYLAAQRRLEQARAALEKARNGARPEVISRARFAVAAQEAVVARLERDLAKTKIRAPFDGFVVVKHTEVGEWIDEGGPVCDMIAIDRVKVRVDVPESAVPFARPGAPVSLEIQALDRAESASITRVIPRANEAARTFPVEIDLANDAHEVLPGMFVWANVPSGPVATRLMASKDAIVARGTQKQVFVIRPGGDGGKMAIPTTVTTGLEDGRLIEVRAAGLQPGDQVVSRANERLFGPTPVVPQAAEPDETQPDETAARPTSGEPAN